MSLMTLKDIYYSVGEFPLLDNIQLEIELKERIALIGRNGEGKSTLLKIIAKDIVPEGGDIVHSSYLKVTRLAQDLPLADDLTVYEVVAQGLADLSALLIQYHQLTQETEHSNEWLNKLQDVQQQIEHHQAWHIQKRIEQVMQAFELPAESKMSALSGGWRRRVALAQALVQEPDILLLDEPTNHLDLNAIQWLENFLLNYPKTVILITHDRALLRKVATRIIELDRGKLTSYPADYDKYLVRKEQQLLEEERQNALFDKKLSQEETWIRQGIKARRTRNEGRVRALKALREERKLRRVRQDKPTFITNEVEQTTGKTVIQAKNISFGYDPTKLIVKDFSFNIQRGDKIAIIGANGTGKTTLIKLLIGTLQPTQGVVTQSPANKIAFFDQNRADLIMDQNLIENVVEGSDYIEIQGKKKHIIGYLGDFLFSPKKCQALAGTLSGGEQNRLLLAKLFSKPANILVLDEPTNDLDMETLDVLEELLLNYSGTVLVISHDREFIDNIATHCISFEANGNIAVNVGGYSDWLARTSSQEENSKKEKKPTKPAAQNVAPQSTESKTKKLTFNQQRELAELPAKIEKLEAKIEEIQALLTQPTFYNQPKAEIEKTHGMLKELEAELAQAYSRWEELE